MLSGVILLWFILTGLSFGFVALDIRRTPEEPVMKLGFLVVTALTGPVGAFLYALGCREPLPGSHERFVSAAWRQVLGSTLHCVAGDGLGILGAAVFARSVRLSMPVELGFEYGAGFMFGWTVFQAAFMRSMAGSSYRRALARTVLPEFLSMNGVMAGMALVMVPAMTRVPGADSPASAAFWFVMSIALVAGLIVSYPINGWLVRRGLKHGMMTVPDAPSATASALIAGLYSGGESLAGRASARPRREACGDGSQPEAVATTGHGHQFTLPGNGSGEVVTRAGLTRVTGLTLALLALALLLASRLAMTK